jgi:rRNA maturation endonuclease Nob1
VRTLDNPFCKRVIVLDTSAFVAGLDPFLTGEDQYTVPEVRKASEVGDSYFLSETDLQLLALAIELKERGLSPLIATDDYSIQNVAKQLGIEFAPLATFGIRRRLEWLRYCPACHKTYPSEYKSSNCEVCGTVLKRKPLRRNPT